MTNVPGGQKGYPGWQMPSTPTDVVHALRFMVEQILGNNSHVALVQVKKVTNNGEVKATGEVDVLPLVNMTDGQGTGHKHQMVHGLPYFRLQGGKDGAIIMDPKVGDIGVAVFADRDISSVKKNKKQANPGSFRRFDMADGLFFPCFLGDVPDTYIRFASGNKIIAATKNNFEFVIAPDHAQIKKKGGLHVTVTKDDIILGKEPTIADDPYPDD